MKTSNRLFWIAPAAGILLLLTGIVIGSQLRTEPSEAHAESESTHPQEASRSGLAAADADGDGIVYQAGMHPWIVEDEPGQCPICGMDLVPVRIDDLSDGSIRIDPVTLQNIGVRTAPVVVEQLQSSVRTTGRFEANEQQIAVVSPKISGWIERLHVNYEGARVAKGEPILEIYSPELVSTQEEYLLALRNRQRLAGTAAADDADRLLAAAQRRLAYWDISDEQIAALEESGTPRKTLTLYAPTSGTVVSTRAVEGQRVTAGETLMQLANLSSLWLMVDLYERDLPWARVGTEAAIELPYQPGSSVVGRIAYIYDALNQETRSVKARIPVPNPRLELKPGMYATVTLVGHDSEPVPIVPTEAVVRSGNSEAVIVALGEGRFLPTTVVTGTESDGRTQVLSGLEGTETVVTSAQFLIDSEARLQSVVAAMISGQDHDGPDGAASSDDQPVLSTPSGDAPASDPHAAGH